MIKKYSFEIKFIVVLFLIFSLILGIYYLNTSIKNNKLKDESFKYYNYHDFSNNISNINKSDLIQDSYLISLLRIDKYNGTITEENINEILPYYLLNITKNKGTSIQEGKNLNFCIGMNDFKKSFNEFFDFNISKSMNLLDNLDYVSYSKNKVCFKMDEDFFYDYYTLIGIDYINFDGEKINAKIYLYDIEADSETEENKIKANLISSLNSGNLKAFNNTISSYEEKNIAFKEIPNGNFFKYQILSVETK